MDIIRKINLKSYGITRAYVMAGFVARFGATVVWFARRAGYFSNFNIYNKLIT